MKEFKSILPLREKQQIKRTEEDREIWAEYWLDVETYQKTEMSI